MAANLKATKKTINVDFVLSMVTGNGYITTKTLREILRELDDRLTNEELDEMIAEIDTDGSGTVDFDGMCSPSLIVYLRTIKGQQKCLHSYITWGLYMNEKKIYI